MVPTGAAEGVGLDEQGGTVFSLNRVVLQRRVADDASDCLVTCAAGWDRLRGPSGFVRCCRVSGPGLHAGSVPGLGVRAILLDRPSTCRTEAHGLGPGESGRMLDLVAEAGRDADLDDAEGWEATWRDSEDPGLFFFDGGSHSLGPSSLLGEPPSKHACAPALASWMQCRPGYGTEHHLHLHTDLPS